MEKQKTTRVRRSVSLPLDVDRFLREQARASGLTANGWLISVLREVRGERLVSDGTVERVRKAKR